MDYEKAYKEALNWMRGIYPTLAGSDKEDAEHYFPELKESDNERIRKEIIHYILYKASGISEEQEHEWVAYLEKQKEQKEEPVERWQYVGEVNLEEDKEEQKPYEPKNWPADNDNLTQEQKLAERSDCSGF